MFYEKDEKIIDFIEKYGKIIMTQNVKIWSYLTVKAEFPNRCGRRQRDMPVNDYFRRVRKWQTNGFIFSAKEMQICGNCSAGKALT